MGKWSLSEILAAQHQDVETSLKAARRVFEHPGTKGDASEYVWIELLNTYLPARYKADKAFVVDSNGSFSDQIDIVIFDRQYSPFIFRFGDQKIVPAESVYAVFESKQSISVEHIKYAKDKIDSVRSLHRTSLPIKSGDRTLDPTTPKSIIGGILTLESDWSPKLGETLRKALVEKDNAIDLGCVASHGYFYRDGDEYTLNTGSKAATSFLFKLTSMLQQCATVPMIDIDAYAKWLDD